jgi:hypothetical protein
MDARTQFRTFVAGLLAFCAVSLVGCQSAKQSGSYSHASLTVKGRSDAEVRQVTKAVFAEEGYALVAEEAEYMGFQRPGSRRDALKWGGWYGEGVVIRAKLKMTKLADDSRLLQLDMFAVRDAGEGTFESESRMVLLNKQPYHQLMNKIGKRLKSK